MSGTAIKQRNRVRRRWKVSVRHDRHGKPEKHQKRGRAATPRATVPTRSSLVAPRTYVPSLRAAAPHLQRAPESLKDPRRSPRSYKSAPL
jgi:hypothetical protein